MGGKKDKQLFLVDMPQQGIEQQPTSIGIISLSKNLTSFSTFFSTTFNLKNESQT